MVHEPQLSISTFPFWEDLALRLTSFKFKLLVDSENLYMAVPIEPNIFRIIFIFIFSSLLCVPLPNI